MCKRACFAASFQLTVSALFPWILAVQRVTPNYAPIFNIEEIFPSLVLLLALEKGTESSLHVLVTCQTIL